MTYNDDDEFVSFQVEKEKVVKYEKVCVASTALVSNDHKMIMPILEKYLKEVFLAYISWAVGICFLMYVPTTRYFARFPASVRN